MAAQRRKKPIIVTPRVPLVWPKLNEVDYGSKEFPTPDGEYSTKVRMVLNDPDTQAYLAKFLPIMEEARALAEQQISTMKVDARKKLVKANGEPGYFANDLYTEVYDPDTEEPTGEVEQKFKMKASGERKNGSRWTRKPTIVDARGHPIKGKLPDIYGGTIARVSFEVYPYFVAGSGAYGVGKTLVGVQIIDLVSGGARTAKEMGFGVEEDGYVYEPDPEDDVSPEFGDESGSSSGEGEDEDF